MKVDIKKLDKNAVVPKHATEGSAGFDLSALLEQTVTIEPGESAIIPTGIAVQLPVGYELQVRPRSGLAAKNQVTVLNTPGTIDSDYTGELKVILINHGKFKFMVSSGDRIAQGVVARYEKIEFNEVDDLQATERGAGGFGSTGK